LVVPAAGAAALLRAEAADDLEPDAPAAGHEAQHASMVRPAAVVAVDERRFLELGDAGKRAEVAVEEVELGAEIGPPLLEAKDLQHVGRGELRAADVAVPERAPVDALELADVDRRLAGERERRSERGKEERGEAAGHRRVPVPQEPSTFCRTASRWSRTAGARPKRLRLAAPRSVGRLLSGAGRSRWPERRSGKNLHE